MDRPAHVNVTEVVDNSRLTGFHIGVFILCGACLIMDGFDVQITGVVAPEIIRELGLVPAQMGAFTTAGLLGILVGAFMFSVLGDRIGRRPVLIVATFCFAALSLMTSLASTLTQLVVLRFLAGVGLGGIMPNLVALVGEYCPKRSRVFIVMLVQNGFNVGAMLVGFTALWLIPEYGWRSVFFVGGLIPLVIGALMLPFLPESLQFLAIRRPGSQALLKWLKRVEPTLTVTPATEFVVPEKPQGGVPVARLFHEGRATGTTLLWVINFMNLVNLYFLSQWLPTVFRDAGMSQSNAIWVGTTLQMGGTVGTLLLGWIISRLGYVRVLTVSFAVGCAAVAFIGQPLALAALFTVVFIAGFCIVGGQGALNALAASFYPTELRSTGVGSALGIGRLGAIAGQPMAATLRSRAWPASDLFLAAAVPALVTTLAIFSLRKQVKPQGGRVTEAPDVVAH